MAEAKHNYSITDSVSLSTIDLQGDRACMKQVHRLAFERNSESVKDQPFPSEQESVHEHKHIQRWLFTGKCTKAGSDTAGGFPLFPSEGGHCLWCRWGPLASPSTKMWCWRWMSHLTLIMRSPFSDVVNDQDGFNFDRLVWCFVFWTDNYFEALWEHGGTFKKFVLAAEFWLLCSLLMLNGTRFNSPVWMW